MGNMKAASRDKISSTSLKKMQTKKLVATISTFRWKPEISDAAAVQGCERHTRPASVVKMCSNRGNALGAEEKQKRTVCDRLAVKRTII